jgi:hypothetical protein
MQQTVFPCCTGQQKLLKYTEFTLTYGLVVKGLSRLPVTEEIAGSNPVEPAKHLKKALWGRFL